MPKKRYNAEEIIHKLREADVLIAQGKTVSDVCKHIGVTDQTYYRWRKEYGGMKVDQAKRLKELEVDDLLIFRPVGVKPETGVIFYHGAETDPRVYGRPLRAIAEQGYLVVAVTMPRYLAVMKPAKADEVIAQFPSISSWVLIGHSMGGAMAAKFAYDNPDKVDGVLLWDAYPPSDNDLTDAVFAVGQIYRTDSNGVAPENFRKAAHLLPDDAMLVAIEDGEHTYFGDYILASHRPVPTTSLTIDEQLDIVIRATNDFLRSVEVTAN